VYQTSFLFVVAAPHPFAAHNTHFAFHFVYTQRCLAAYLLGQDDLYSLLNVSLLVSHLSLKGNCVAGGIHSIRVPHPSKKRSVG
jgi:hypothetical protein